MAATFTVHGPSVAHARFEEPTPFDVIFTGRGCEDPAVCHTQTLVFVPSRSPVAWFRVVVVLYALLTADRRTLEAQRFQRNFTDDDEPLRTWVAKIEELPTW